MFTYRLFFFVLISLSVSSINAQSNPKRLLGNFILNEKTYTYEFTMEASDSYSFNISSLTEEKPESNPEKKDSTDSGDKEAAPPKSATPFKEFSKDIFGAIFTSQMETKFQITAEKSADAAAETFFKIKARLDFIDDQPITAFFIMKKNYIYSILKNNASRYYNGILSHLLVRHYINRIDAETEDGTIKNISVYLVAPDFVKMNVVSPRSFLLFKNQFPISISGKFDYEKFSKINLYCFNCSGIDGLSRYVRLSDLAILDIVYENDKEDYSPANISFSATPAHPIVELKKERRSKILEVAAFTDFVGLDRNEPNGLIQVETRRKINLNTRYRLLNSRRKNTELLSQIDLGNYKQGSTHHNSRSNSTTYTLLSKSVDTGDKKSLDIVIPNTPFHTTYFSFFNYIEPKLLFSKLEQNNKFVDSLKAPIKIVDPITLYQHQLATFGVTLQLFRLSFPQIKLQWNLLNAGAYWGRTRVALSSDSSGPTRAINSNYWEIGSNFIFRPDNRWGVSIGIIYMLPRIWNTGYSLTSKNGIFADQFDAWLKTSGDDKLFFRFRWTYENHNRNNNFTQIQLGYSLNLFAGTNNVKQGQK